MAEAESSVLETSGKECVVLPTQLVMTVTSCPLPSAIREHLRFHYSWGCHCDNRYQQLHSLYHPSCYSYGSTVYGNGPGPLCVSETPEPLAGAGAIPEEITAPAENQAEDLLRDPNLPLNIEESNKEFMAESEELYDSLMNCRWQPLDTVLCSSPEEPPQCEASMRDALQLPC
ncbi:LOW QUALITY PROTEIN: putative uncharacterized protein C6orf52 homolog [Grammomys surdaster]|uniref:LOW QUALITY PROTEIN: putative uncharacterized protein C6orf52 homolog n=1 Tax=Grammomys surdaster TaxID=491861 RepID=UPI00109FFC5A|nr:LOW QUALITY PROTEIN: putative uncharacterized protein C6orf52 homolog [Grammomys surdaster]